MKKVYGTEIKVNSKVKGSAPITEEALRFIQTHAAGSTVLEIGCGSGIYAKLLREIGVTVIATDACRINKEGLLPPNHSNRMAKFSNIKAINNMIEKNAVQAVKNNGQNTNLSLFLSFPLYNIFLNSSAQYDEIALRDFKGNKFFLIAMYNDRLPNTINYDIRYANGSTGSGGFHDYLAEEWYIKEKLLLETGRIEPEQHCYLIYFERKTAKNMSGSAGTNRKCPKK
jgi:hypothetical protein